MSNGTNTAGTEPKIVLLGVGSAAAGIVASLATRSDADWLRFVTVDTQPLAMDNPPQRVTHLTIGSEWTRGLGCGGDPEVAAKIVDAAGSDLQRAFSGGDLLLVVGCLGRGTASGVVPALARLAREAEVLPMFLLTLPFSVEGNNRMAIARRALDVTRQSTDVVVALSNDLLFGSLPDDITLEDAFKTAGELLGGAASGLAEMVRCRGPIPLDFASLRNLLKGQAATCTLGFARVEALDEPDAMVASALASPLFGGADRLHEADVVVATLVGKGMSLKAMQGVLGGLQEQVRDETRTLVGANEAAPVGGGVQLSILAIHYDPQATARASSRNAAAAASPATAVAAEARPRKRRARKGADPRQIDLPFLETTTSLGIFAQAHPTLFQSENLDIPTFQRRGIEVRVDPDET